MVTRFRLSVFRSCKHIYCQIIDDRVGVTICSASTLNDVSVKSGANQDAAAAVGKLIGERALKLGVEFVVFDRGAYRYHGRVARLAEEARNAGLKF